jgi:hypothetical protein
VTTTGPTPPTPTSTNPALRCIARHLRIRLRLRRGVRVTSARLYINRRRVRVVRGKRLRSLIDLGTPPPGRFTVRIVARTPSGRRIVQKRRYTTCATKLKKVKRRRHRPGHPRPRA